MAARALLQFFLHIVIQLPNQELSHLVAHDITIAFDYSFTSSTFPLFRL
jgi:hypothetical protein